MALVRRLLLLPKGGAAKKAINPADVYFDMVGSIFLALNGKYVETVGQIYDVLNGKYFDR